MTLLISEDVKLLMYSTWLPALISATLEEIKRLPVGDRDRLLRRMCGTCEDLAMSGAVGIRPGMSWEEYVRFLRELPPPVGPWTVRQSASVFMT